MKPKQRVFCPAIQRSKMVFETEQKAERFIKFNGDEIKDSNDPQKKVKLRAYYCPACGGYHITHKPMTSYMKIKDDAILQKINEVSKKRREKEIKKEKAKEISPSVKLLKTLRDVLISKEFIEEAKNNKTFKKVIRDFAEKNKISSNEIIEMFSLIKGITCNDFKKNREIFVAFVDKRELNKKARSIANSIPKDLMGDKDQILSRLRWEYLFIHPCSLNILMRAFELLKI